MSIADSKQLQQVHRTPQYVIKTTISMLRQIIYGRLYEKISQQAIVKVNREWLTFYVSD